MKQFHKTPLAFTLGTTLLSGLAANVHAGSSLSGENPFAMRELSSGYMLTAEADTTKPDAEKSDGKESKKMEGSCGEGKCGAAMMQGAKSGEDKGTSAADAKAMEGKCAGMKK
jgi:uncharacterized low-complexity protein